MNPDSTLAVTQTCPKDGVHLYRHRCHPPERRQPMLATSDPEAIASAQPAPELEPDSQ